MKVTPFDYIPYFDRRLVFAEATCGVSGCKIYKPLNTGYEQHELKSFRLYCASL